MSFCKAKASQEQEEVNGFSMSVEVARHQHALGCKNMQRPLQVTPLGSVACATPGQRSTASQEMRHLDLLYYLLSFFLKVVLWVINASSEEETKA